MAATEAQAISAPPLLKQYSTQVKAETCPMPTSSAEACVIFAVIWIMRLIQLCSKVGSDANIGCQITSKHLGPLSITCH